MKSKISLKPLLMRKIKEVKKRCALLFSDEDDDIRESIGQYCAETGATFNAAFLKFIREGLYLHEKKSEAGAGVCPFCGGKVK